MQRRWLWTAVAVALALGLMPARWGWWANALSDLATALIAPIKQPVSAFARWAVPAGGAADSGVTTRLEQEREHFKRLYLQERRKVEEREAKIGQLGGVLTAEPGVRQLYAPVIGSSSDGYSGMVEVRAGRAKGVEQNTVATVGGVQLLGRVERVGPLSCWVRLVTDRQAGMLAGRVMVDEGPGLGCNLHPTADGRFQGQVEYAASPTSPGGVPVRPGQEVRLDDGEWPKSAAMLLIGTVESVQPARDHPMRQIVVVKPTVERLGRASEVVLRISVQPDEEGGR